MSGLSESKVYKRDAPVNYIDLILSFVLFVMGVLFIIRKRFRSNLWVVVLALLFFPISLSLFLIGCIRAVYNAKFLVPPHIKASDIIIIMFSLFLGILGLLADMIAKLHKVK